MWPSLPVDTSLTGSSDSAIPMSRGIPFIQYPLSAKLSTVVVAEGIPPVACHLVEKLGYGNVN